MMTGTSHSPFDTDQSLPGTALGDYVVQQQVFGNEQVTVFSAYQAQNHRPVLIRVLAAQLMRQFGFRAAYLSEKQSLTSLEHPHILPVLAVGEYKNRPYIVVPDVSGRTLQDVLDSERLPYADIATFMAQLAGALDFLHAHDILHRNLNPETVLVDDYGNLLFTHVGIPA
ncbi:MAG TPA: protein kinase, partial [Aggregatilineales bacterium]|nr:protein kinase [Aggregatilineales bacterium]